MYAEGNALAGSASDYRNAGMIAGAGAIGQDVRQSEIEREIHRLLNTAESLDGCVAMLLGRLEKITVPEPKSDGSKHLSGISPAPGTMLGRDLDSINSRIQNSISTLQSTIQRIEL